MEAHNSQSLFDVKGETNPSTIVENEVDMINKSGKSLASCA